MPRFQSTLRIPERLPRAIPIAIPIAIQCDTNRHPASFQKTSTSYSFGLGVFSLRRIEALDGVRGVAVILVLIHHIGGSLFDGLPLGPTATRITLFFLHLFHLGWMGVDIFFVLSGFLITGILLKTRTSSHFWSGFYLKRIFRILPAFLVIIGVITVREFSLHHLSLGQALLYLSPFSNWFILTSGPSLLLNHVWSLAIEEQFYLLWPLAVRNLAPRRVLVTALGIATASTLLYVALAIARLGGHALYYATPTRLTGIALGSALAAATQLPSAHAWLQRHNRSIARVAITLLVVGYLVGRFSIEWLSAHEAIFGILGASLLTCTVIFSAMESRLPSPLSAFLTSHPLRWFGARSYAIYLIHIPVTIYVITHLPKLHLTAAGQAMLNCAAVFAIVSLSCLLAELSWRLLEAPSLRLGARITHRREALLQDIALTSL